MLFCFFAIHVHILSTEFHVEYNVIRHGLNSISFIHLYQIYLQLTKIISSINF